MPPPRSLLRFSTVPGLARAFRAWARSCETNKVPDVDGATEDERRLLAALGGIAAGVAGDHVAAWPASLREWAEAAPECPAELVDGVCEVLGAEHDPLSVLYEASISRPHRRRLGTVFTPPVVVNHMLDLAADALDGDEPRCMEKALSEEALTSVVMLRYNLYQQVSRVLGTRLGSLKDKADAAARAA